MTFEPMIEHVLERGKEMMGHQHQDVEEEEEEEAEEDTEAVKSPKQTRKPGQGDKNQGNSEGNDAKQKNE